MPAGAAALDVGLCAVVEADDVPRANVTADRSGESATGTRTAAQGLEHGCAEHIGGVDVDGTVRELDRERIPGDRPGGL